VGRALLAGGGGGLTAASVCASTLLIGASALVGSSGGAADGATPAALGWLSAELCGRGTAEAVLGPALAGWAAI